MTPVQQKSGLSPAARFLVLSASFIIIVAGIRSAGSIVVPFLLSAFIAVICTSPLFWLKRKGIPSGIAVLIVLVGIFLVGLILAALIGTSLNDFSDQLPTYQARLHEETTKLFGWLNEKGVNISGEKLLEYVNPGKAFGLFASTLKSFRTVLTDALLIVITVIFMLLELSGFPEKLRDALGTSPSSSIGMDKVTDGIKQYMMIKTLTSLATGVFITIWLAIIGVDFPVLWGVVAFVLNFVPNIGSIIAAIPAVLLALIQLGIFPALHAAIAFLVVNFVIGTVLEPRIMGQGVGLSTLVVFLSLVFWGWVLGPVGMLLSVPLTMVVKIGLENNEGTRKIAVLLS
jgi:predicted PurR-regulated permease PerM